MSIKFHTLMMLEDSGLSIRYPNIRYVEIDSEGNGHLTISACCLAGRRVSIEQNQPIKFLMMFTLLDLHVDSIFPQMEGMSFAQKYKSLPAGDDYSVILRELYRVSKLIRNSLVHSPSRFKMVDGYLDIDYCFGKTNYRLKISFDTLGVLYTSLLMCIKDNMGRGEYFFGMLRSFYKEFVCGVVEFSDEFGGDLQSSSDGLEIYPYMRELVLNPNFVLSDGFVQIKIKNVSTFEWMGTDFYIIYDGVDVLLPREALDEELKIDSQEMLDKWKYQGPFPSLKKSN